MMQASPFKDASHSRATSASKTLMPTSTAPGQSRSILEVGETANNLQGKTSKNYGTCKKEAGKDTKYIDMIVGKYYQRKHANSKLDKSSKQVSQSKASVVERESVDINHGQDTSGSRIQVLPAESDSKPLEAEM